MKPFQKILFSLSALFLLISCNSNHETSSDIQTNITPATENSNEVIVTKEQFRSAEMSLTQIDTAVFYDVVNTKGYLDVPPDKKAFVSTYLGGYVKHINLLSGEKVKKGQILLTLVNPEYLELQQSYIEVKEQLSYLKAEYERQQNLAKENIASRKYLEKVKSDYNQSLAKFNSLKEKLKLLNINTSEVENNHLTSEISLPAPISGNIVELNASLGKYMSPSDIILSIVNTDHFHLELSVFEKDILKIKKGQIIRFRIPNTGNKIYTGSVFLKSNAVNSKNRSILVHGHLDQNNPEFITGMYVEASILTRKSVAPSLPAKAVVESDGKSFILVLKSENQDQLIFEKKLIKTGRHSENNIEVLNNEIINNDVKVLMNGAFYLL
jgi:cobalt-zinc-cadmium efflux system membrane fusion protein